MSRNISFLAEPAHATSGAALRVTSASRFVRMSVLVAPASSSVPDVQNPAGDKAQTERARPRRASSIAIHPPIEFPATCTDRKPRSSNSCSVTSINCSIVALPTTGGPPRCPAAVGTMRSKSSARNGTTRSQAAADIVMPCRSSNGGLDDMELFTELSPRPGEWSRLHR